MKRVRCAQKMLDSQESEREGGRSEGKGQQGVTVMSCEYSHSESERLLSCRIPMMLQ